MRTLTHSEKLILLGVFGGAAFVVGNFFLYGIVEEKKAALVQKHTVLDARIFQLEELQKEKEEWHSKRAWVEARLPVYRSVNDRETFLISLVNNAARSAGLEIVNGPNQIPGSQGDYFEETGVSATVKGNAESIVRWIYSLQDPDAFRAISSIKIDAAKRDPSEITCELTVVQWWSPDSEAYAATGEPGSPLPTGAGPPGATSGVVAGAAAAGDPSPPAEASPSSTAENGESEVVSANGTASADAETVVGRTPVGLALPTGPAPDPLGVARSPEGGGTERRLALPAVAAANSEPRRDPDDESDEEEMDGEGDNAPPPPSRRVVLPPSAR